MSKEDKENKLELIARCKLATLEAMKDGYNSINAIVLSVGGVSDGEKYLFHSSLIVDMLESMMSNGDLIKTDMINCPPYVFISITDKGVEYLKDAANGEARKKTNKKGGFRALSKPKVYLAITDLKAGEKAECNGEPHSFAYTSYLSSAVLVGEDIAEGQNCYFSQVNQKLMRVKDTKEFKDNKEIEFGGPDIYISATKIHRNGAVLFDEANKICYSVDRDVYAHRIAKMAAHDIDAGQPCIIGVDSYVWQYDSDASPHLDGEFDD